MNEYHQPKPPRGPGAGPPFTPFPQGKRKESGIDVPWSVGDSFAIIALVAVSIIVFFSIAGVFISFSMIFTDIDGESLQESIVITSAGFFLQWAVTLGVAFTYLKIRGYRLRLATLGFRKPASIGKTIILIIGLLVSFYIFLGIYSVLIEEYLPELVPVPQEVREMYGFSFLSFVIALSQVAIITPVLEELFFRGIIHQALEKNLGFFFGAVISSAVFALAHIDFTLYLPIFILGFGFAYLMHRTRSIWPSIGAHFLVNLWAVVAQFFLS